jgi:hypothetical protein
MNFYKGVFDDCTVEELKNFWSDPRHETKTNHVENMKACKCLTCKDNIKMTKGPVSPSGNVTYIVSCKKEMCTIHIHWDSFSNIQCKEEAEK